MVMTHLKFVDCECEHLHKESTIKLINQIWHLPKLVHFYWAMFLPGGSDSIVPTIVSRSLEHLCYPKFKWSSEDLACLIEKTPRLRYVSVSAPTYDDISEESVSYVITFGHTLKHELVMTSPSMMSFLQQVYVSMPNPRGTLHVYAPLDRRHAEEF